MKLTAISSIVAMLAPMVVAEDIGVTVKIKIEGGGGVWEVYPGPTTCFDRPEGVNNAKMLAITPEGHECTFFSDAGCVTPTSPKSIFQSTEETLLGFGPGPIISGLNIASWRCK